MCCKEKKRKEKKLSGFRSDKVVMVEKKCRPMESKTKL